MKRRNLLKSLGAVGVVTILPFAKSIGKIIPLRKGLSKSAGCWLTPAKTEGPYYFNANLFRQDIRYDSDTQAFHNGLPLNMTFSIIDANCNPISNVLIDIWHADKDGVYSGYSQPGGNTVGQDFMRGIQITDENGQASVVTSYPGWYQGRATHIHFKVRLNSTTFVTSQFCFPDEINDAVYATPLYSGRGPNPITNAEDNIFGSSLPEYLVMDVVENQSTGGYDGTYTIGINSPTGVTEVDANPIGFTLEQNYPNPFNPTTTIRYTLASASDVKLTVFDMFGREIETLVNSSVPAGTYEVVFDASKLSSGIYFYRLIAGKFTKTKEMLLIK